MRMQNLQLNKTYTLLLFPVHDVTQRIFHAHRQRKEEWCSTLSNAKSQDGSIIVPWIRDEIGREA